MNDDEKRLLLACAACLLAERTGLGPDQESQARVLRSFLKPFQDWMESDMHNHPFWTSGPGRPQ